MSLNGLNGELERKNCDREEEIARLQATIKKLSDDVTELVSTIEKLKTTLQTKSESLSIKVQEEAVERDRLAGIVCSKAHLSCVVTRKHTLRRRSRRRNICKRKETSCRRKSRPRPTTSCCSIGRCKR